MLKGKVRTIQRSLKKKKKKRSNKHSKKHILKEKKKLEMGCKSTILITEEQGEWTE